MQNEQRTILQSTSKNTSTSTWINWRLVLTTLPVGRSPLTINLSIWLSSLVNAMSSRRLKLGLSLSLLLFQHPLQFPMQVFTVKSPERKNVNVTIIDLFFVWMPDPSPSWFWLWLGTNHLLQTWTPPLEDKRAEEPNFSSNHHSAI